MTLKAQCKRHGINYGTVRKRLRSRKPDGRKWTLEAALTTPVDERKSRARRAA